MSIPLVGGRSLVPDDGARGFPAAVGSESFARHWWPDGGAIGRRIREDESDAWLEIVGGVGDVRLDSLKEPPPEVVYYPLERGLAESLRVPLSMHFVLRTAHEPADIMPLIREEVWAVDRRLPITASRPMEQILDSSVARTSFTMTMLGIAASVALLLGTVGIYGVVSYVVGSRTAEIGVRIALGAPAAAVRRMIVGRGLLVALVGIALGTAAALLLSSALASLLYGVSATDPATYTAVAVVLVLVAATASWLPARRASAVDPIVALRAE